MRKQGYELLFVTLVAGWLIHTVSALCYSGFMWTLDALGVSITYESLSEPERGRAVMIGGLAAALLLAMIVNLLLGRGKRHSALLETRAT